MIAAGSALEVGATASHTVDLRGPPDSGGGHRRLGYLPVRGEGFACLSWPGGGVVMDVVVDAGAGTRLHPADLPLVLQEQLERLAVRRDAGASDAELAGLVAELRRLREW